MDTAAAVHGAREFIQSMFERVEKARIKGQVEVHVGLSDMASLLRVAEVGVRFCERALELKSSR